MKQNNNKDLPNFQVVDLGEENFLEIITYLSTCFYLSHCYHLFICLCEGESFPILFIS